MPAVNDANCAQEKIRVMAEPVRTKFASLCFRRGRYEYEKPMNWANPGK